MFIQGLWIIKIVFIGKVLCLLIITTLSATLSASDELDKDEVSYLESKLIKETEKSYQYEKSRQLIALDLAPIKSKADLFEIAQQKSVLDLLSDSAKERFISSIVFGDNGVTSFQYSDLEVELSPTQIYKILSLFGVQHTVHMMENSRIQTTTDMLLLKKPVSEKIELLELNTNNYSTTQSSHGIADHKGYACTGRATCSERQGSICMSGC
jgi:hypothetical protein